MSNWHNENYSGNDLGYTYPVEVIPKPLRRVIRFSFRFYVLMVCLGAFLWGTYAAIQAVRHLSASPHATQPASTEHHRNQHFTKGQRP